jgi:D-proline reductase (dithiol) PrdB
MEILEDREKWLAEFQSGWLAYYQQTGGIDWGTYPHPANHHAVVGPGVDLKTSRLMLITSSGCYLPKDHQPFDAAHPLGDYSIRLVASSTLPRNLAFAHDHFDHAAVRRDVEVQVPLRHLGELVAEGVIGELAPSVVSFMGYQPDASRVVDETIPAILRAVEAEQVRAAFLVPA